MSGPVHMSHQIAMSGDVFAQEEEGGGRTVPFQDLQEMRSRAIVRTVVICECDVVVIGPSGERGRRPP